MMQNFEPRRRKDAEEFMVNLFFLRPPASPRLRRKLIMIFEYETLKLIWWLFIGLLLIGFAVMDGFDMGVGMLLPFLGKTDEERRVIINSIGATWEGNQTWLITGAGATFAAWPLVYATRSPAFTSC